MRQQWTVRRVAQGMAVVLAASLVTAIALPAEASAGPSVPLADTPSVPVTAQQTAPGPEGDETTPRRLHGDQGSRSTLPGAGTYSATSLKASSSWNVSTQTGTFSWSYPLRVPPSPGGLQPSLALSYSSSAVDGLTSATNNQASWIGDGWSMWPGFIERSYGSCVDDVDGPDEDKPHDLCWRTDNATLSFSGGSGQLIKDSSGKWRLKADDGSRIERTTSAGNGDNNGESWKVTTVDGTQYFFGTRTEAKSTWTVPVFGDDADEPCHQATFADSWCTQAYRWNLDKVVDRHGNVMHYFYETETNKYGRNKGSASSSYVRGGWLSRIEYGLRADQTVSPTGKVIFEVTDRCVPGSDCTLDKPDNLPDVPLDFKCDDGTCDEHPAPSFWTTKRLHKITTQVRRDGGFDAVDSWTLRHELPDPGDGEKPALWLKGITHTGHLGSGSDVSLPEVTFDGVRKPNRMHGTDGYASLIRFRMSAIVSEAGGITSIKYAEPDCVHGSAMPANPETNTKRCYPVTWTPLHSPERTDYFHKYVVEEISSSDRVEGSIATVTSYEYVGGAAWHYDESELTKNEDKTWNQFRGYGRVISRHGNGYDGPKNKTERVFYRGMHGDNLPDGSRTVDIADSEGGAARDENWLNGRVRETITYDGDTAIVAAKTIMEPTWQGPTATRGDLASYIVGNGTTTSYTALKSGGWRQTRMETSYDDRGLPVRVNDLGDLSTASDDRCVHTTYVRNYSAWLLSFASRVQTLAVHCAATPVFPDHAISDVRVSFDNQSFGKPPIRGTATRTEVVKDYSADAPVYVTTGTAEYDATGRAVKVTNALGEAVTTSHTPTVGGPVTKVVMTNPIGHQVATTVEPGNGSPLLIEDQNARLTETAYDALGRVSKVWTADRKRADGASPTAEFAYTIRQDGPAVITTTAIGPNGNYITTNKLFDGLLRERQVQEPAPGGGRLLTDVRYDSHGRQARITQPYFNDAPVDTVLSLPNDADVPGMTVPEFDGVGRVVAEIFKGGGLEKWRKSTVYEGDQIHVTPPRGGTTTTSFLDAHGRRTELRQYHDRNRSGDYEKTTYRYAPAGQLTKLTGPAGKIWTFEYDLRGRQVRTQDPDRGATTYTYDDAGRPVSTTDARGVTLVTGYDLLGRKTTLHRDSATGLKLAEWTYDTSFRGKGLPATATRYVGTSAYTTKIAAYNARYQPLRLDVKIPATEGALAGTYYTRMHYNQDGSLASTSLPAAGNIPAETISHSYDDLGMIKRTWGGFNGYTFEYALDTSYTRLGELQRLTLGEGTKRAWLSYIYEDHTRRLSRTVVDAEVPKPMIADVNYAYDPAGNITSIADTPREAPADVQCFTYDHLQRLTEAWTPTNGCAASRDVATLGGPAPYWKSFSYDEASNRHTDTTHTTGGDTTRTYDYSVPGIAHALKSVTTTQPSGTAILDQFEYDAAGNTTVRNLAGDSQHLEWSAEGQLIKVTDSDKVTEFVHDADGGRLIRRDDSGTTLYLPGQEIHVTKGTTVKTGTRHYSHGPGVIAVREGSGLNWLAGDHKSTPTIAINASSLAVSQRRQMPFGSSRGVKPIFPGSRGFVGGTIDSSIDLVTLGARHYDPELGRFISVDPLLITDDPQSGNGYTYASNNPITYSDPTGLWTDTGGPGRPMEEWQRDSVREAESPTPDPQVQQDLEYMGAVGAATDQVRGEYKTLYEAAFGLGDYASPMGPTFDAYQFTLLRKFIGFELCDGSYAQWICDRFNAPSFGEMFITGVVQHAGLGGRSGGSGWSGRRTFDPAGPGARAFSTPKARQQLIACTHNSFPADTLVLMADGSKKPIEDVEVGDLVLATDPESDQTGPREVTALITGTGKKTLVEVIIDIDGDYGARTATITATNEHPFWVDERQQWTDARALRIGDELVTPTRERVTVLAIRVRPNTLTVHNLTVDDLHTYYVLAGEVPVLIHNAGGPKDPLNFGGGYTGRLDKFTIGGQADFEIHVYRRGREVGIFGSNGWFPKHGKGADVIVPRNVYNSLKGLAVIELRAANRIGPKGTVSIKGDAWKRPRITGGC